MHETIRSAARASAGSSPARACRAKAIAVLARRREPRRARHQRHLFAHARQADRDGLRAARDLPTPGTAVAIDIRGRREPAHVVKLPFYRRSAKSASHLRNTTRDARQIAVRQDARMGPSSTGSGGEQIATVGISAFAVEALTDLVYIELPKVGRQVKAGESFGEIESVKAVSDLYSPVDGEVVEVNERRCPSKLEHAARRSLRRGLDRQDQDRPTTPA